MPSADIKTPWLPANMTVTPLSARPADRNELVLPLLRWAVLLPLLALVAAGCASQRPVTGALVATQAPATGAREHAILIATTRARDTSAGTYFSGERTASDDGIDFARATISIPPEHKDGAIEWPRRFPGDPAKQFVTRSAGYLDDEAAFQAALRRQLANRPADERDILVFVHGFNTLFAEGTYRMAQIVEDTGFKGVPVLFTWASRGRVVDYVYDRDSATAARDALERTLQIASASGARKIHLLAHSMGNWVTIEALRQARIGGHGTFDGHLGQVVLASPDVDVDVFKTQMKRLGRPADPFTMLISKNDRALSVSSKLAGGKARVGGYENDREIAELGVVVIDLTRVESDDSLHHGKFAQAPQIVQLIGTQLSSGTTLAVKRSDFAEKVNRLGSNLGGLVGATADIVITAPAMVLQAPGSLIAGQ